MTSPDFMKTYPQPTRTAANRAPLVEIPPRGSRPARRGSFWPGESFTSATRRWDLTGAFLEHGFVLPALAGQPGPKTL